MTTSSTPAAPAPAFDFASFGAYSDVSTPYIKALIVGPPKAGKTIGLVGTSPRPLVLNCDSKTGLLGVKVHFPNAEYQALNITSIAAWEKGINIAAKAIKAGAIDTVIVDTLTLLADKILDELKEQGFKEFTLWNRYDELLRQNIERVTELDANVFATAHIDAGHEDGAGILPLIPGSGKRKIAGLFDHWILLDCDPQKKPMRRFLLGAQKEWRGDCRGLQKAMEVEATFPALKAALLGEKKEKATTS